MEPRPLTNEERQYLVDLMAGNTLMAHAWRDETEPVYKIIEALISAEAYWREEAEWYYDLSII